MDYEGSTATSPPSYASGTKRLQHIILHLSSLTRSKNVFYVHKFSYNCQSFNRMSKATKMEYRAVIKFLTGEDLYPHNIKVLMDGVYEENAASYSVVKEW